MRILLLGGGGREHALAWKIAGSSLLDQLFILPGNPGTSTLGTNLPGDVMDFELIRKMVFDHGIDMVVVGPEDPLVKGIRDFFLTDPALSQVMVIGPDSRGAMLEGSKDFAKQFMQKYGIPTAGYRSFTGREIAEALTYLKTLAPPYVLKADGLAAGKGVVIHDDLQKAEEDLKSMLLDGKFGKAGATVVVEEFLDGIEMSVFVLTDGHSFLLMPEAKDYKKIGEGDTGLNTGGMGTLSPVPFFDLQLKKKVERQIIRPTIQGLISEGILYKGFIFFGLMIVKGEPFVIEYNVRLGDPEAESILPRIGNDLVPMLRAVGEGTLDHHTLEITSDHVATVMLVSGGYPGDYSRGKAITGVESSEAVHHFHAGTAIVDHMLVTHGGRVMAITSHGSSLSEALNLSYDHAAKVLFEGKYFRRDIGQDVLPFNKQ